MESGANRGKNVYKSESAILHENEVKANKLIIYVLPLLALFYFIFIIVALFNKDVLPDAIKTPSISILCAVVIIFVGDLIFGILKKEKHYTKYILMIVLIIASSLVDLVFCFSYFAPILLMPAILSLRYCDYKFTLKVTLIAYITFFIINFFSTYYSIGYIDLDFHVFKPGFVVTIGKTTYEEMIANVDGLATFTNSLYVIILPLSLFSIIPVIVSIAISKSNKDMISDKIASVEEITRTKAELNVAGEIQREMVPNDFYELNRDPRFNIYAVMYPAKEVGGDFYDTFMVDEHRIACLVADVSGKGVPAALFMARAKTAIKDYVLSGLSLTEALEKANEVLQRNNKARLFVTVWSAIIDLNTGVMTYVNAGHNYSIIVSKTDNAYILRNRPQRFLAFFDNLKYEECSLKLKANERLFIYTDGVTEAVNKQMKQYGTNRLLEIVNKYKNESIVDCLASIKNDVDEFSRDKEQFDDITMLLLEYKGGNN